VWNLIWVGEGLLSLDLCSQVLDVVCLLLSIEEVMVAVTSEGNLFLEDAIFDGMSGCLLSISKSVLGHLEQFHLWRSVRDLQKLVCIGDGEKSN